MSADEVFFSFVIPAFNEKRHIVAALDSVIAQTYPVFDTVVVDDGSTDGTRQLVEGLAAAERVRLVTHERSRGSGAARNSGVAHARGDVIVFLDADVTVPPDFLLRLIDHYRRGADAVAIESRVADQRSVPGRFQQAQHEVNYPNMHGVVFSQAFSCRRAVADTIKFPEHLPGTASADDAAFGEQLVAGKYALVCEPGVVVNHALPTTIHELWRQYVKRGRAVVHTDLDVHGRSYHATAVRRSAAFLRALFGVMLVAPAVVKALRLTRRSPRGFHDVGAMWLLHHLHLAAYYWGQLSELQATSKSEYGL